MLKILYFARLRDQLGTGEEYLARPESVTTLQQLRQLLIARSDTWEKSLSATNIRMAVNQKITKGDAPLGDDDEVAFFPPVTGG